MVFGTGAVGGYFGGRLAEAGEDVRFVARGEHLNAIRRDGLRVTSPKGDFVVRPADVAADPRELGPVDVVLLGVKAWQVEQAAEAIRSLTQRDTWVVPLQNGIEAADQLGAALGTDRVVGGFCRIIAYLTAPGHVHHAGGEPYVGIGELNGHRSSRAEALREAFARAPGLSVEIVPDIRVAMWSKFLFIAAMSGAGSLTRAPIGAVRSQPESRALLRGAMEEVYRVGIASGVALPADSVEKALAFADSLPPDGTTSMQRDIAEGRPSELEAQVGAVVRVGERLGVDVPIFRSTYAALLPLERSARGATWP
jgi:2-dehydropantoate 2-reductase